MKDNIVIIVLEDAGIYLDFVTFQIQSLNR